MCAKIIDLGKMGEYALDSHRKSKKHAALEASIPSMKRSGGFFVLNHVRAMLRVVLIVMSPDLIKRP